MKATLMMLATAYVWATLFGSTALGVSISVWHSLTPTLGVETFDQIVEEFRAAHPDINVDVVYAGGYVPSVEKAIAAFAGGAPPNVLLVEQTRGAALYYGGALLPIDRYVNGPDGIDLSDFSQTMLGAVTFDGVLYGLPYNVSTPLLYYNRDMFRAAGLSGEAPRSSAELLEYSSKIARDTDGNGAADTAGIDFYSWGWLFEAHLGRAGARVLNNDLSSFTFNSPEAVNAMEFAQRMVHQHRAARFDMNYSHFWSGQLAMREVSTASLANNIRNARENSMDMGVAPLVCDTECYAPIGGGNFFALNTGSPAEQEATWKFLKHITSTENYARYSASSGYMAARRSAFMSPILQDVFDDEPEYRVTYEQMNWAYPRPKVPFWQSDVAPLLADLWRAQFHENAPVKSLLDEAVRQANTRLAEWNFERH